MNISREKFALSPFVKLTAIIFAALLLRVHGLAAQSFWYDEGATLWFATGGWERWISDTHPPLYYALVHSWLRFGHTEYWLRLLSVIPAVATIPVIYSLGKKMFGTSAGLLAATFMALLGFHIDHSQQARMYTFFVLFYACTMWALITIAREGRERHWVSYVIAASLLAYSQGIGILYVAMIAVLFPIVLPQPWRVSVWFRFFLANAIVILLYFPWLMLLTRDQFRVGFISWVSRPDWFSIPATLFSFISIYIPFTSIPHFRRGILLLRAVAVAVTITPALSLIWFAVRGTFSNGKRWAMLTAVSSLALPLLTVYLLSIFITPLYIDRVLLPATVGFVLILGATIQEGRKPAPRLLIYSALLISGINTYYFFQYRYKEDFRSLSRDLQYSSKSQDMILFVSDSRLPQVLIEYYDRQATLAAATKLDLQRILHSCRGSSFDECINPYTRELKESRRVWIVYAHDKGIADREAIQRWLDSHFMPVSVKSYKVSLKLSETQAIGF
jgi:mannosyltransferase